ncbi:MULTISPECIES: hypothetical protein [unclassified Nocardioides]|uniref:hypothetical protein n=1 Tax=unclassified Nocardioides TaxID=2615069 RepID=UPI000AC57756|nr:MULTISPECIES: hypothetical protein [unclassified Nocardioides]
MKFTEREMTEAVDAVGQKVFAASRPLKRNHDEAWQALSKIEKYHHRAAAGEMILTALIALPERPTVGSPPQFTPEEYAEAATAGTRQLMDHRRPGAWDGLSSRKQKALVKATAMMVEIGVLAMPIRQDPDAFIVPDHL